MGTDAPDGWPRDPRLGIGGGRGFYSPDEYCRWRELTERTSKERPRIFATDVSVRPLDGWSGPMFRHPCYEHREVRKALNLARWHSLSWYEAELEQSAA